MQETRKSLTIIVSKQLPSSQTLGECGVYWALCYVCTICSCTTRRVCAVSRCTQTVNGGTRENLSLTVDFNELKQVSEIACCNQAGLICVGLLIFFFLLYCSVCFRYQHKSNSSTWVWYPPVPLSLFNPWPWKPAVRNKNPTATD